MVISLDSRLISDIVACMKRVLVQVSEETHLAWKMVAKSKGMSMSELARKLIEVYVAKESS